MINPSLSSSHENNDDMELVIAWHRLAKSTRQVSMFGLVFSHRLGEPLQVVGNFRDHRLKIYYARRNRTYIVLSANNPSGQHLSQKDKHFGEQLTAQDVTPLLMPHGLIYRFRAYLTVKANGQKIIYEQPYLEYDLKYLGPLLNLLSNLAHTYPKIVALGGEAVPALQAIAREADKVIRPVAHQLLKDIARETKSRLRHQTTSLLCSRCLAHPTAHKVRESWWKTIKYYGCRVCGQSREFLEKRGIVVLDREMVTEQSEQGDEVLRVNWLARRTLFDFDEVQIWRATDEEVEGFAIQAGNDTDLVRRSRYKKMRCVISPDCRLSENTIRILERMFGWIETKEF